MQPVPRGQIFALERRDGRSVRVRQPRLHDRTHTAQPFDGQGQFLDVNVPVAAAFQHPTERDHRGKHRVSVPASCKLADLWPRIRIKNVVARRTDTGIEQLPPEIDQIGAYPHEILGPLALPPIFTAHDAALRLIDTDDEVIGKLRRQPQRAFTDTAPRVDNQRCGPGIAPRGDRCLEGGRAVGGERLAKHSVAMAIDEIRQFVVRTGLSTGDSA